MNRYSNEISRLYPGIRKKAAAFVRKYAGILADEFGGIPANAVGGALGLPMGAVDLGGTVHGAFSDVDEEKIRKIRDNGVGLSFVPGVGKSRALRKKRYYAKGSDAGTTNIAGEYLGGLPSTLVSTLGGGVIGAGLGGLAGLASGKSGGGLAGMGIGGIAGAGAGLGVAAIANLAALIAAAAVKRRTAAEQAAHDSSTAARDWLMPGASTYDYWKRVGAIKGIEDEEEEKAKKAKA